MAVNITAIVALCEFLLIFSFRLRKNIVEIKISVLPNKTDRRLCSNVKYIIILGKENPIDRECVRNIVGIITIT